MLTNTNIIICGSKDFFDFYFMTQNIRKLLPIDTKGDNPYTLLSRSSIGADIMGERLAKIFKFKDIQVFQPKYSLYGKLATVMRDNHMIDLVEDGIVFAFWNGRSIGTRHMINRALDKGLETHIFIWKPFNGRS